MMCYLLHLLTIRRTSVLIEGSHLYRLSASASYSAVGKYPSPLRLSMEVGDMDDCRGIIPFQVFGPVAQMVIVPSLLKQTTSHH